MLFRSIALAHAQPGKLNYASAGNGSTLHLTGELFRRMAGIDIVHVPYKGSAPGLTDLLAGHVQMTFNPATLTLPHAKTGRLRVLGVTTLKRVTFAPEIPAIAESGVPGFAASGWYGLFGPRGIAPAQVSVLYDTVKKSFADREFGERFAALGAVPLAGDPTAFAAFIQSELAKWGKVVRESGARID